MEISAAATTASTSGMPYSHPSRGQPITGMAGMGGANQQSVNKVVVAREVPLNYRSVVFGAGVSLWGDSAYILHCKVWPFIIDRNASILVLL